jgi:N-acetylmuramoyl-L-alanine amidase
MTKKVVWIMLCLLFWSLAGPGASAAKPPSIAVGPVDVLLDVGHGGIDGGTSYQGILEKDINLAVARMLYQQLSKRGYHVVLNRTKDYALSDDNEWLSSSSRHRRDLAQRLHLGKTMQPQIMVSLHVNWSTNTNRRGGIVIYNDQARLLAAHIQKELNSMYHTRREEVRGKTFYLLNHADWPAVIVEMGFLSNPQDRETLTNRKTQETIVQAISDAIDAYFILF